MQSPRVTPTRDKWIRDWARSMIDPRADKRLLLARSGMFVGACDDRMIVATLPMPAGKMHLPSLAIGLPAPKRSSRSRSG